MEYIRKFRWATYYSIKCREYLRHDFSHECAYCKLHERETGFVGKNFFEIDHFKPQSADLADVNRYENLYYSCETCNNAKSGIIDDRLLDPCLDDIFSGENPAIIGGKKENNYKLEATNDKGEFYITTFKLNSRNQIYLRKSRENRQNILIETNKLLGEIISKVETVDNSDDSNCLVNKLYELQVKKQAELIDIKKCEIFEQAEEYLCEKNINNQFVFEEYNMDIKLIIKKNTYYCELIVDNTNELKEEYIKFIQTEKITTWFEKLNVRFGILFYFPNINQMYFYPISEVLSASSIPADRKAIQVKIGSNCLIN